jgi:hypothetical protein
MAGQIPKRLLLAGALVLTVVASLWLELEDNANITRPSPASVSSAARRPQSGEGELPAALDADAEIRPAEDAFAPRSWYVPPPQEKPLPPPAPTPPPLPFAYLGKMVEEGQTILFLIHGDRTLAARVGDIIDDLYRIDAIEEGGIRFTYLPLDRRQTLPMENAP